MLWKRNGLIFNARTQNQCCGSIGYAQGPQVLQINDGYRVYFSFRKISLNSKFVSHVSFIEFDFDFKKIKENACIEPISPGELGNFDEHGIFPFSIIRADNRVYGFSCGWSRRISVSIDMAIGLSISNDDGKNFLKTGTGPILSATLKEPFLIGDPNVHYFRNKFHMWYIAGREWTVDANGTPQRDYQIRHATSTNLVDWSRDDTTQIIDHLIENEVQAMPSVIRLGDYYLMAFCYRSKFDFKENIEKSYRIGFAKSYDLITWSRIDSKLSFLEYDNGIDDRMQCYPNLIANSDTIYLLYNGNNFGRDGILLRTCQRKDLEIAAEF